RTAAHAKPARVKITFGFARIALFPVRTGCTEHVSVAGNRVNNTTGRLRSSQRRVPSLKN
ncbi:MAG: hypothetical protein WB774_07575, partial [Xanthobacteraceae bacterium]